MAHACEQPNRPGPPRPATRRDGQRGASLSEYALILAVFVMFTSIAIESLTGSGTDLLDATGDGIATPRPYGEVIAVAPIAPAPPWVATTTVPSSLLTYVDKPIQIFDGTCLSTTGTVTCGEPDQLLLSALSTDGINLAIYVGGDTVCLSGNAAVAPPVVSPALCETAGGRIWQESSANGLSVSYRHQSSGLCLTAVVAAAPADPAADPAEPAGLGLEPCDGRPEQVFVVQY